MSLNIPVDCPNIVDIIISVDFQRRNYTLEDLTISHPAFVNPNAFMNQPNESSHITRNPVLKDLRPSGTDTEVMQGTISETVCDSSPLTEAVNVNEDENGDENAIATSTDRRQASPSLPSTLPLVQAQSIPLSLEPPEWASDTSSTVCVACNSRFTMIRRRHHCRTCGRLLCATCTPHRVPLPPSFSPSSAYSSPEGSLLRLVSGSNVTTAGSNETRLHRVCVQCFRQMFRGSPVQAYPSPTITVASSSSTMPASRIQAPSSQTLEGAESIAPQAILQRRPLSPSLVSSMLKDDCLIPPAASQSSWPPLVIATTPELVLESQPSNDRVRDLMASDGGTVTFAVTRNLHVLVSIVGVNVWSFLSHGLYTVGQEEVCLLLRRREGETTPPIDALVQYFLLYDLAFFPCCSYFQTRTKPTSTNSITSASFLDEGSCLLLPNPFADQQHQQSSSSTWFDGTCCGFLYVRACSRYAEALTDLLCLFPTPPFLISLVLRHPSEVTWATRHPLRLLLTLSQSSNCAFPLISDRDRLPVFSADGATASSVLSLCSASRGKGAVLCVYVPELNILVSGLGGRGELRLQLLFRRSAHEHVRRALQSVGHGESLLFGLTGNFCPSADCHLYVSDSATGLTTGLTPHDSMDPSKMVVGASFVLIEGVEGCNSSLTVVEDGCVARLTTEQFKALLTHMRSASPLQLRIETAPGLSTTPPPLSGGLITVNWVDEAAPIHFTSLHCSLIDGRLVEPRCTFVIPREQQLRHWLVRRRLCDDGNEGMFANVQPRISWTRLHSLASRPVYVVDNRSGEVLDLFAVFNAVAATFINRVFNKRSSLPVPKLKAKWLAETCGSDAVDVKLDGLVRSHVFAVDAELVPLK
ncbi:unnamed protein product [Hydatigera taeniaeformis]|uniref:FYVE-type domain-containing protein n=1 Tax=Hydatigena taeniaeformis TaxID=6205 RepID=A0A0R3WL81_HYDTA|nr:unnamed protein product [Hydatigera taeniaeformis]